MKETVTLYMIRMALGHPSAIYNGFGHHLEIWVDIGGEQSDVCTYSPALGISYISIPMEGVESEVCIFDSSCGIFPDLQGCPV